MQGIPDPVLLTTAQNSIREIEGETHTALRTDMIRFFVSNSKRSPRWLNFFQIWNPLRSPVSLINKQREKL
jgi:hypothetical protein